MPKEFRPENYRPRLIDEQIQWSLSKFGGVSVEGPKWCGKTWSSRMAAKSHISLARAEDRRAVEAQPGAMLAGEVPRLIDEWQERPEIWDEIRVEIDDRGKRGQFILTGSSAPRVGAVSHEGIGRIDRLRMGTMSLFESGDSSGAARLSDVMDGSLTVAPAKSVSIRRIAELIMRGGWPAVISDEGDTGGFGERYYRYLLDRIHQEGPVDPYLIKWFLRSLARNECSTAKVTTFMNDVRNLTGGKGLSYKTASKYLAICERLYITDLIEPCIFSLRSSSKVSTLPKYRLFDPALTFLILHGEYPEKMLEDANTMGLLFESMCLRDLSVYAQANGCVLEYYRDSLQNEIDAVIRQRRGPKWAAFEIKMNPDRINSAAEKLVAMTKKAPKGGQPPSALGVIVATGEYAYKRKEDDVYVLPICSLRN